MWFPQLEKYLESIRANTEQSDAKVERLFNLFYTPAIDPELSNLIDMEALKVWCYSRIQRYASEGYEGFLRNVARDTQFLRNTMFALSAIDSDGLNGFLQCLK